MPVNWDEINPNKAAHLISPREIYAALPDKKYRRLRPEQSEVLERWFGRRNESSDLVVKQNTGGGKTLVGLLIAQSSLNENIGPAVFLVPDNFLITQVVEEAQAAGIKVATDTRDDDFLSSRAILVTTFHKLLNGRSTFGVLGQKTVIPLGIVVVDDAHTALASSRSIFSATIPSSSKGYKELFKLFSADLRAQSPKSFSDLRNGEYSAPIRVPPKSVVDKSLEMLDVVRKYSNDPNIGSLFYAWPFVADSLDLSIVTFTRLGVEVKTPCPQVSLIPAFDQAPRRVYLTATLADEGVLVTELGAKAAGILKPITPGQASDLGDRLILAPLSINPNLSDLAIHALARNFADGDRVGDSSRADSPVNVVVLVPSDKAADRWSHVADEILHVHDMDKTVKRLSNGEHVGVVVLVNKYDGVDLPNSACRLLIIDGVPKPLTAHEQRESSALIGSPTFKVRQVQKIEQGMGRGIRDVEDYCAVLVLTRDAALTLRDPSVRAHYSPATRAQIELSVQLADQIQGEGIEEIRNVLYSFLERQEPWMSKSIEATADVKYDQVGMVSAISAARRKSFDLAIAGDVAGAVAHLKSAIDSVKDDSSKGWYLEELAGYEQLIDPLSSQRTLAAARKRNPAVLKPAVSSAPRPIKGPVAQAEAAAAFLASRYSDADTLRLATGAIFDNIVWGVEESADLAEEQVRVLGEHLGFGSTRPDKYDDDGGPDNLWAMSPKSHAVIELKTEISRPDPLVNKSEAGQLGHSLVWHGDLFPGIETVTPVLVHPSSTLTSEAHLPKGARVMDPEHLELLARNVKAFADGLAAGNDWADPSSVATGLQRNDLTAERILQVHTIKASRRK